MPKYTFQCAPCNLLFSRVLPIKDHTEHPCPQCKKEASRKVEGFAFSFKEGKGSDQANTGVHSQDYPTADNIVGRSAEKRWLGYSERAKIKMKARKLGGSQALARVDGKGYIDYMPMSQEGRQARVKLEGKVVKELRNKPK